MTTETHSERSQRDWLAARWPVILGFAALAASTISKLANQSWTEESGAQGPIILATGAWLIWRLLPKFNREAKTGSGWVVGLALAACLICYIFGSIVDLITFEAAGLLGTGITLLYSRYGARVLRKNWFPFFYLAFAVPPPAYFVTALTAPLKAFVSRAATDLVAQMGFPVSHEGVVINIAQYQLLVEDACSGMNSIFGLLAIGLFYIYLMHGSSLRYSVLLAALMIPIAIAANIVRVIFVILLTFYFGDAVGQGFLHFAAGLFLFVIALLMVFGLDALLSRAFLRQRAVT